MIKNDTHFINSPVFFNNRDECIQNFRKLSFCTQLKSFSISFINLAKMITYLVRRFFAGEALSPFSDESISRTGKRLVVCIHGLDDKPIRFQEIVHTMQQRGDPETHFYVPAVKNRGKTSLDEATAPIFDQIKQWAKTGGDKELVLVGISNGARIALNIDAQLHSIPECNPIKKVKFVSIVGANCGSKRVNRLPKWLTSLLYGSSIAHEMGALSDRSRKLTADWDKALRTQSNISRSYTFYAAAHDFIIPNFSSTLMPMPKHMSIPTEYAIVPNHGHCSIVDGISESIIQKAFE